MQQGVRISEESFLICETGGDLTNTPYTGLYTDAIAMVGGQSINQVASDFEGIKIGPLRRSILDSNGLHDNEE
jgi:hypothetical protein